MIIFHFIYYQIHAQLFINENMYNFYSGPTQKPRQRANKLACAGHPLGLTCLAMWHGSVVSSKAREVVENMRRLLIACWLLSSQVLRGCRQSIRSAKALGIGISTENRQIKICFCFCFCFCCCRRSLWFIQVIRSTKKITAYFDSRDFH